MSGFDRVINLLLVAGGFLGVTGFHFGFGNVDPIEFLAAWIMLSTGLVLDKLERSGRGE